MQKPGWKKTGSGKVFFLLLLFYHSKLTRPGCLFSFWVTKESPDLLFYTLFFPPHILNTIFFRFANWPRFLKTRIVGADWEHVNDDENERKFPMPLSHFFWFLKIKVCFKPYKNFSSCRFSCTPESFFRVQIWKKSNWETEKNSGVQDLKFF